MPHSGIEIRVCKTWDECLQCEELQYRVWEMPDYRDVVPANLLITAAKNGGLLIGAFDGSRMVGFAFGFLGSEGTGAAQRLKHTSHMLAVLPGFRKSGLGTALKWRQRQEALNQGLELMTWTYDPLQGVNASLNLARLGAIARRYIVNAYGTMTDALNAGLDSDRFDVEWYLASARVRALECGPTSRAAVPVGQFVYTIRWDDAGFPAIAGESPLAGETLLVEIPENLNALRASNLNHGLEWRARTRDTFQRAFAAGYVACDVWRLTDEQGRIRIYYELRQYLPIP